MALKMSIEGLRFRASDGNLKAADQLKILRQRLSNPAGMPRVRAGDNPADMMGYLDVRQPVDLSISEIGGVSAPFATKGANIEIPEMIDNPRLPFKVMKGIATGGQIVALVKAGYEIRGHNSDKLKAIIADESNADKGICLVSLLDGRALAEELNRQNPGRKFRVSTEEELLKLNELIGDQLSGRHFWIWTETETEKGSGDFILCPMVDILLVGDHPGRRSYINAVRLVEDR